jgi:hypothetical protein
MPLLKARTLVMVLPKIVAEMPGHGSTGLTLDVYSHALPDTQQEAATAVDAVFGHG